MKRTILMIIVIASLLLTACGASGTPSAESTPIPTVIADSVIIAEGRIEPVHYAEMAFNANGLVGELLVTEGDSVKAGDVIARLANSEALQAEVARTEEAYLLAEQSFSGAEAEALKSLADAHDLVRQIQYDMDAFYIPSDLKQMTPRDALKYTYDKYETARIAFEPYRSWNPQNKTAKLYKKQMDNAWGDYRKAIDWAELDSKLEDAKVKLEQAQKEVDNLGNDNEMTVARAQFETARANLDAARAALEDVELRAPFDGTVASLKVRTGETVSAGQVVVTLADFSSWIVKTTDLTELDVVSVAEGQLVTVNLDALPDSTLNGEVQAIGQTYAEKQGDVVYEVTVGLNDALPNMRWGMTAVVKFSE